MFRLFRLGPKMRVYRGRTRLISHIRGVAQPQIEDKGRVPQKRQSACRVRQEQRRVANTLRVERTRHLEGSRFVTWQLYGLVSRRLPGTSRGVEVLWALVSRRPE